MLERERGDGSSGDGTEESSNTGSSLNCRATASAKAAAHIVAHAPGRRARPPPPARDRSFAPDGESGPVHAMPTRATRGSRSCRPASGSSGWRTTIARKAHRASAREQDHALSTRVANQSRGAPRRGGRGEVAFGLRSARSKGGPATPRNRRWRPEVTEGKARRVRLESRLARDF